MSVIAIANRKGGATKTTTAVNVGAELAARGFQVTILDLDSQGNAGSYLGIDRSSALIEALEAGEELAPLVQPSEVEGLSVIAASRALDDPIERGDRPWVFDERPHHLAKAIESVSADFILIDCPPSLNFWTRSALAAADYLLIPFVASSVNVDGLGDMLDAMNTIRSRYNVGLEVIGAVATMFENTNAAASAFDDACDRIGDLVFDAYVRKNVAVTDSYTYKKPVREHAPSSNGAADYKDVTTELLERIDG